METFTSLVEVIPVVMDAEGVLRVGNTRVTLDTLVAGFLAGATPEELAQQYPSVNLGDIYSVIGYYLRHAAELEEYFGRRQQETQQVREQNEVYFTSQGIRDRLLARRGSEH